MQSDESPGGAAARAIPPGSSGGCAGAGSEPAGSDDLLLAARSPTVHSGLWPGARLWLRGRSTVWTSRKRLASALAATRASELYRQKPDRGWILFRVAWTSAAFGINLHRERGRAAAARVRALPTARVPRLATLNLPPTVEAWRSGRATRPAWRSNRVGEDDNACSARERDRPRGGTHIVTIEDPMEYEHRHPSAW